MTISRSFFSYFSPLVSRTNKSIFTSHCKYTGNEACCFCLAFFEKFISEFINNSVMFINRFIPDSEGMKNEWLHWFMASPFAENTHTRSYAHAEGSRIQTCSRILVELPLGSDFWLAYVKWIWFFAVGATLLHWIGARLENSNCLKDGIQFDFVWLRYGNITDLGYSEWVPTTND